MADYDGIKRDQNALRFKIVRAPLRFFLRASRQNRRERERESRNNGRGVWYWSNKKKEKKEKVVDALGIR